ncbi:MAG: PleD family two-component system response regulator [Chloroflexia bacterium]|nr:PleD family two-component system response regulator [Chloroflexia bacterium]
MEQQPAPRQKILLVDDTPANLVILGDELQDEYEVFVATNGFQALKMVDSNPPDLIVLDIMMPMMDGYEVCRQLKENPATSGIPIIFITAMDAEEDETRGLEAGAVDYITKPFHLPIVKARVRTHSELKRKTDILQNLSSRDGLTGIFNRRRFDEVLDLEWRRAARKRQPLSLILLDIDEFKGYNDNYGHLAGDQCLQQVATILGSSLRRAGDFLARYGGEEFVIILPDTAREQARHIAERMRQAVAEQRIEHAFSRVAPYLTISVGVVSTEPGQSINHQGLLQLADEAMYRAKNSGRNCVVHQVLPNNST